MLKVYNIMRKKINFSAMILLLLIVSCGFLSGCSTTSSNYTSKYNGYSKIPNLPKDYPTKYLPNGNIWNDFNRNAQLPTNLNQPSVKAQLNFYIRNQDFLNRSLTRGAQYFYYIFQETKKRNLPAELALIPIFESGYIPVGKSDQGAVGLWQFMPGTAKHFKIKMNKWYDGRRDVIDSTETALRYLTYLYYFFDKDWYLAISAYNCGEGRVQQAILRNKRQGKKTDFWSLQLPKQTKSYLPQLLAISAILKNPQKYGVSIVPINDGPYFDRVRLGRQISLDKASKLSGASEWSMRMLNAGLSRGITDPSGPHIVSIPRTNMEKFRNNLFGSSKLMPTTNSAKQMNIETTDEPIKNLPPNNSVVLHGINHNEVSSVENVNTIEMQKEDASDLAKLANQEHSKVSSQISDNASSVSFDQNEDIERDDSQKVTMKTQNTKSKQRSSITKKNSTNTKKNVNANINTSNHNNKMKSMPSKTDTQKANTKNTKTKVNSTKANSNNVGNANNVNKANTNATSKGRKYVVGRYDTLSSIARQYGTTIDSIRRNNNLRSDSIKPNMVLHIPNHK